MKSKGVANGKPKSDGPSRRTRGSGAPDSVSGNYDCPREQMIAEAAYYHAERRGFTPGNEMSDWLRAEVDVEGLLHSGQ